MKQNVGLNKIDRIASNKFAMVSYPFTKRTLNLNQYLRSQNDPDTNDELSLREANKFLPNMHSMEATSQDITASDPPPQSAPTKEKMGPFLKRFNFDPKRRVSMLQHTSSDLTDDSNGSRIHANKIPTDFSGMSTMGKFSRPGQANHTNNSENESCNDETDKDFQSLVDRTATSTIVYDSVRRKFMKTKNTNGSFTTPSSVSMSKTLTTRMDGIKDLGFKRWTTEIANTCGNGSKSVSTSGKRKHVPKTPHSAYNNRGPKSKGYGTWGTKGSSTVPSNGKKPSVPPSVGTTGPSNNFNEPVIVALVEGRGHAKGEIGLASINLRSPNLIISQFPDNPTYAKTIAKLHVLFPIEIVMPSTVIDKGAMSELMNMILNQFPNGNIVTIKRQYFKDSIGYEYIKSLALPDSNELELEVKSKYNAVSATAALFKYVEYIQDIVYAPGSLNITYVSSEKSMLIDTSTAKHLELIENMTDRQNHKTLFGCLNFTKTKGGARLLRANLLQPPKDKDTIEIRYECVDELLSNENLFYSLQSLICHFNDFENALALCAQLPKTDKNIRHCDWKIGAFIDLKHTLKRVSSLKYLLNQFHNPMFVIFRKLLNEPTFKIIEEKLDQILIVDHKHTKISNEFTKQKCFAVKANEYSLLEITRKIYLNLQEELTELASKINEKYKLDLRIIYNQTRGHFFYKRDATKLKIDKKPNFPEEFVKISRGFKGFNLTTIELLNLNDRINQCVEDMLWMSSRILTEFYEEIKEYLGCLYKLAEALPLIDLMVAYAHWATLNNTVKPYISEQLDIRLSRHPILEKCVPSEYIPNNIEMSRLNNFAILTGPNMSGKTTYIKQVALLQIMAQIGCHIPCEFAQIKIFDRILSFFGCQDEIENNLSTQMTELKRIKFILQNANSESLILIDELGIATDTNLGAGISYAVSEELINIKSYTYFATHFKTLCRLEDAYPMVQNYHLDASFEKDSTNKERLRYSYMLRLQPFENFHYGMKIFEQCSFPDKVMQKIKESFFKNSRDNKTLANKERHTSTDNRPNTNMLYKLAYDIYRITISKDDTDIQIFKDKLWRLKNLYTRGYLQTYGSQPVPKNSYANNLLNFDIKRTNLSGGKGKSNDNLQPTKRISSFIEAMLKSSDMDNTKKSTINPDSSKSFSKSIEGESSSSSVSNNNDHPLSVTKDTELPLLTENFQNKHFSQNGTFFLEERETLPNHNSLSKLSNIDFDSKLAQSKSSKYFGSNVASSAIPYKIRYPTNFEPHHMIENIGNFSVTNLTRPAKGEENNLSSSPAFKETDENDLSVDRISTPALGCPEEISPINKAHPHLCEIADISLTLHSSESSNSPRMDVGNDKFQENLIDLQTKNNDGKNCFVRILTSNSLIPVHSMVQNKLDYKTSSKFIAEKVSNFYLFDESVENSPIY